MSTPTQTRVRRVLIANRGEIAVRIASTCRRMGIETVAVFSDADAEMPHVRIADMAVRIGPAPARESYLKTDALLAAAKRAGADAIHPGYGFLSENADFARAVIAAGLTFIGPKPENIDAMGRKREAKATVEALGVPVVPGHSGSTEEMPAAAERIGYPVLLKASAGGGGKGMRRVDDASQLESALESAEREAASSFGDATVILEKYVERPRHIEIQILGDALGHVVHLHERECSVQRRHQKVIEETPAPGLDDATRRAMGDAAVTIGSALGYEGAGTVEFILAPSGEFYFLEVNTRLQVEHTVTEEVFGLDLVQLQIDVAEGRPLPFAQEDLEPCGAAIQVRLYAEDDAYLPQSGRVLDFHLGAHARLDTGIEAGSEIGIHYDPMMAKLITFGRDRRQAIDLMLAALRSLSVQGITNNRRMLMAVLQHEVFESGQLHTHFLDEHVLAPEPVTIDVIRAAICAAIVTELSAHPSPIPGLSWGFRNNASALTRLSCATVLGNHEVGYAPQRDSAKIRLTVDGDESSIAFRVLGLDGPATLVRLEVDGLRTTARVVRDGDRAFVHTCGHSIRLDFEPRFPLPEREVIAGACVAPMPGRVVAVQVGVGETVAQGDALVVIEAMKMEQTLTANADGVVASVAVEAGEHVDADALLVVVRAVEDTDSINEPG